MERGDSRQLAREVKGCLWALGLLSSSSSSGLLAKQRDKYLGDTNLFTAEDLFPFKLSCLGYILKRWGIRVNRVSDFITT